MSNHGKIMKYSIFNFPYLDLELLVEDDILILDVSMKNVATVQVRHGRHHLSNTGALRL